MIRFVTKGLNPCVNRTREEAAQSHESDDALGAQKRGENQISHSGSDISNGGEDAGACGSATKDSFPPTEIIFISRRAAYPLFLALTNDDDKATNGELHPIKSQRHNLFPLPHPPPFVRVCRAVAINLQGYMRDARARRAKRIRSRASKKRAYIRAALP